MIIVSAIAGFIISKLKKPGPYAPVSPSPQITDHLRIDGNLQSKMDAFIATGDSEGALQLMDRAIASGIGFTCAPCNEWAMKRDAYRVNSESAKIVPTGWKPNLPPSFASFFDIVGTTNTGATAFPCAAKDNKGVWIPGQWSDDDRNCHARGEADEKIEVTEKEAQFLASVESHWADKLDASAALKIGELVPCKFRKRGETVFDVFGWTKSSDPQTCRAAQFISNGSNGEIITFLNRGSKPKNHKAALKPAPNDSWKLYDTTSSTTEISGMDYSKYFKNREPKYKTACAIRPKPDEDPFVVGTLSDDACHVAHADGVVSERERFWLPAYDVVDDDPAELRTTLVGSTPACMVKDDAGNDVAVGNVQNDVCEYVTSMQDKRVSDKQAICYVRDKNDPSVSTEGFDLGDGVCLPRHTVERKTSRNWKPIGRRTVKKEDRWVDDFAQADSTKIKYKGFKLSFDPKKGLIGESSELNITPCAASIDGVWIPGYSLEKNNCNIVHPDRDEPMYADKGIKYAKAATDADTTPKPLAFEPGIAGRVPCMVNNQNGGLPGYIMGDSCRYLHMMGQTEGPFDIAKMAVPKMSKTFHDIVI
jgi:hypothetical protein